MTKKILMDFIFPNLMVAQLLIGTYKKLHNDSDLYFNKKKYLQAWKLKMAAKYEVAV
jgi:hypothetical protein